MAPLVGDVVALSGSLSSAGPALGGAGARGADVACARCRSEVGLIGRCGRWQGA